MFRSYLPYLLALLLTGVACNPGNYDLASCEPNITTLSMDACNALNDKNADCTMLYQCDGVTHSCKLSPRDYDRDGDPDVACGGTDCNDYDATVSGVNKLCGCDQSKINQPCAVGLGACRVTATYTCRTGALFCAMPLPTRDDASFAAAADTRTSSWDLNCDGREETACTDKNGLLGTCGAANCGGTTFSTESTPEQVAAACSSYCGTFTSKIADCTNDHTLYCNPACGKAVHYCSCKVDTNLLGQKSCVTTGNAIKSSTVLCK